MIALASNDAQVLRMVSAHRQQQFPCRHLARLVAGCHQIPRGRESGGPPKLDRLDAAVADVVDASR